MPSGRYDLTKLDDCVRLVSSTAPRQDLREAMLALIHRTPGAPTSEAILQKMKEQTP